MRLLVPVLLLACACGVAGPGGPGPTGLDPALNGSWNGTATATIQGDPPYSYQARLVIAVSGNTASVADVCPNGDGSFVTTGSGESATWTGSLLCSTVALTGCSTVAFTYTSGSVSLNGGTLSAAGQGSGTGCGLTKPFTMSFSGVH